MARGRAIRRPAVSVLCPTNHPGPLVAAALGELRPVVDEIVIAADARVGEADLGEYASVADTLLRYEHFGPNRHWAWLAEQAGGDWLLLLDGDELVSASLLAALGELVADPRISQYSIPTTWLWPAPASYLTDEPWASDRRTRLVRNDDRAIFPGRKHEVALEQYPIRYLSAVSILHLDLVLNDRAERERKVARYDAELFGRMTPAGAPHNRAFYLPEAAGRPPRTCATSPRDLTRVERVVSATRRADPLERADVPMHDAATLARRWSRRTLPADAYRARLAFPRPLPAMSAGGHPYPVWVQVTNAGTAQWPGMDRQPLIRLGLGWRDAEGDEPDRTARTLLPHGLRPGETTLVPLAVASPPRPGRATLVVDLVHEFVRWFDCPATATFDVGPGADERLRAEGVGTHERVPLATARRVRVAIGSADALFADSRAGWATPDPLAPAVQALVSDLPIGGHAVDRPTIERLTQIVTDRRPRTVIEFGSGSTTVVLAHLLRTLHGDACRLTSIDESATYLHGTHQLLQEHDLLERVALVHAPLEAADGTPACYALDADRRGLLGRDPAQLVVVDGPSLDSGASRLATADLAMPFAQDGATLLLDDAFRDAELLIAEAWSARGDIEVTGIWPTPRGLLEAHLRPRDAT